MLLRPVVPCRAPCWSGLCCPANTAKAAKGRPASWHTPWLPGIPPGSLAPDRAGARFHAPLTVAGYRVGMDPIFHIASRADWERAVGDGVYMTSTRGVSLAEQGYIHASGAAQVAGVANAFYRDAGEELVLLVIDPGRVNAEIRYEDVPGADAPFPHIYGPLNPDAVVGVRAFAPGPDGDFAFASGDF